MEIKISKRLYWTPRILSIIFICFLFLMSLDVLSLGLTFWQTVAAFFLHSLPAILLLITLIISWKYEIVGGVVFILGGLAYIAMLAKNPFEWYYLSWAIQISGGAFFIGILFIIGWVKKIKSKKHEPNKNNQ